MTWNKESLLELYLTQEHDRIKDMNKQDFLSYAGHMYHFEDTETLPEWKATYIKLQKILKKDLAEDEIRTLVDLEEDKLYDKWVVDLPDVHNLDYESPWVSVASFKTKAEAIEWAKENLGADDEGKLSIISSL